MIMVSTGHRLFQFCVTEASPASTLMGAGGQHNHQSSGRIQSLSLHSEKAVQIEWHTKEVACTTLEQGWAMKRTDLAHSLYCWQTAGWGTVISPYHNITHGIRGKAQLSHSFHPRYHQQWKQTWIPHPACSRLLGTDGNEKHCCVSPWCNQPVHGARTPFHLHQE